MRISTAYFQQRGLDSILDAQAQASTIQSKIASGKRVNRPSDDPVASAQIHRLLEARSQTGQYQRNGILVTNRLSLEEDILGTAQNTLLRIRELALQANNASLTSADRQAIAQEVTQRYEELLGLANSRDANGEYMFSGTAATTLPFIKQPDGTVTYAGDQYSRNIQIAPGRQIADSDTGFDLFLNVSNGNGVFKVDQNPLNSGTGISNQGRIIDPVTYSNETYTITFVTNAAGNLAYNVNGSVSGQIIPPIPQNPVTAAPDFISGAEIVFNGVAIGISGTPASGDTFSLSPSNKQSVFQTIDSLVSTLQINALSEAEAAHVHNNINRALNDLDRAVDKNIETRAGIGARLNSLETQQEVNDIFLFEIESTLSIAQDLDITEAVVELQRKITSLEAAQTAFVRIQNLSLFDLL